MSVEAPPALPARAQHVEFLALLQKSLDTATFSRLALTKHRGDEPELQRVIARRLTLRGEPCLSFTWRYTTRDLTKNLPLAEAVACVEKLLHAFEHAHLLTTTQDMQLAVNRKGRTRLRVGRAPVSVRPDEEHDREKQHLLALDRPFLSTLGITDDAHRLIPSMSRKWKQINKFIEVLDHALAESGLKEAKSMRVIDFGSGKAYLSFAVHDYLTNTLGLDASVTGVELRAELVQFCNQSAQRLGIETLAFEQGDIRSHASVPMDIMIALHACDTATDFALHSGIRAGAAIIMCAPCCHKELRPQMRTPLLLKPLLQHGIHLGQEAEMLTDGLRSLLLESEGYDSRIFEFVSLEHTSKNKMILAVKRRGPAVSSQARRDAVLAQIRALKDFYGVEAQSLETLLLKDAAKA